MTTSKVGRLVSELFALAAPVVMPLVRRLPGLVAGAAVLLTLLGVFVLASSALDDAAIDAHRGVAVAEVLDGSGPNQTLVRFGTGDGRVIAPETGAFYPGLLRPGDKVLVDYDMREPERVRIAGRSAAVGIVPILLGIVGVWVVAVPLIAWLRRQPFTIAGERARRRRP